MKKQLRDIDIRTKDELSFNGLNEITQKNYKHLQTDQIVKSVFESIPFVSFHIVHNLCSFVLSFTL